MRSAPLHRVRRHRRTKACRCRLPRAISSKESSRRSNSAKQPFGVQLANGAITPGSVSPVWIWTGVANETFTGDLNDQLDRLTFFRTAHGNARERKIFALELRDLRHIANRLRGRRTVRDALHDPIAIGGRGPLRHVARRLRACRGGRCRASRRRRTRWLLRVCCSSTYDRSGDSDTTRRPFSVDLHAVTQLSTLPAQHIAIRGIFACCR